MNIPTTVLVAGSADHAKNLITELGGSRTTSVVGDIRVVHPKTIMFGLKFERAIVTSEAIESGTPEFFADLTKRATHITYLNSRI